MSRIHGLIEEIKAFQKEKNHRSALQVFRMMDGNRKLFLSHIDETDLNFLINNFENLSNTAPKDYNSTGFKRDFDAAFESLLFHLNRIF